MSGDIIERFLRRFFDPDRNYFTRGGGGIDAKGRSYSTPQYLNIPPEDYARHWDLEGPR